ncbi:MAG: flavodoxin family protein [Planctomycetota bacterium]|nr:flavodoxin family protein [Planctomycetota bacterium]
MTNVLIVNSSPRSCSCSRFLAARVGEGAAGNGHPVSTVEIGGADIHPCTGCDACRERPGGCVIADDMAGLYPKVARAEILIFSSPIYFFSVGAQLKLFLDRLYALGIAGFANKGIGAVFAYGDEDPVKSGCVNAIRMFQDICGYASARWLGAIYASAWDGAAGPPEPLLKSAGEFGESLA